MKKIAVSLIGILTFGFAYSQQIHYPQAFTNTLAQAASLNKLVFLTIEPPANVRHANEASGLQNAETAAFYDQHFVSFSVNYDDTIAQPLIKWYNTTTYPAYVIADKEGNLLNKGYGPDTTPAFFMRLGQKALDAQSSGRTIGNYSLRYRLGNRDTTFLKDYITIREELGFYDNARLAEDYVVLLPLVDADNYNKVLFILKAGPYAYGKAYKFCHFNKQVIDSIYKHDFSNINRRIANNTMDFAINNKRLDIAQSAARYVAGTWSNNKRRAAAANDARMLDYYWGIRDTSSYLSLATFYYDEYYMTISTDSVKKTTPLTAYKNTIPTDSIGPNTVTTVLNRAAYNFYLSGTRNQTYLSKAMLWVVHAIELYPDCHNFDTLAHLLYRLGYFSDAEANELHAIEFAKRANMSGIIIDRYGAELNKIKNKQLK